jgi:hypothetical protein
VEKGSVLPLFSRCSDVVDVVVIFVVVENFGTRMMRMLLKDMIIFFFARLTHYSARIRAAVLPTVYSDERPQLPDDVHLPRAKE